MIQDVRAALGLLDGPARRRGAILVVLAFLVAALEAFAAALVFLLVGLVGDPRMVMTSRLLIPFKSLLREPTATSLMIGVAIATAAVSLLKNGLALVEARVATGWTQGELDRTSARIFGSYLHADHAFHLRRDSASLIHNVNGAVYTTFQTLFAGLRAAFSEAIAVLALVAVLVVKAPLVCLGMLVVLGCGVGGVLRVTQRRFDVLGKTVHRLNLEVARTLRDAFGGIRDVKLFAQEARFEGSFRKARAELAAVQVERAVYDAAPRIVVEALFVAGVVTIVVLSATLGPFRGPGLVPLLGLLSYAGLRLLPSVHRLVFYVSQIRIGRPALRVVMADLERLARAAQPAGLVEPPLPFERELAAEGVSFAYQGSSRPILRDVDLRIARGEFVGIVGATGAGKSTLLDVLCGLLPPAAGRVTVDGVDIAGQERRWQRRVSCVPQAPYLLDGSMESNIVFSAADAPVDRERLASAVGRAQLGGLLETLPEGLATTIGERGVRISGGERQRVALARALYREPDILVLDEATSSLDHDTERAIADALESLRSRKTLIVVAHRMKTVERCDRLFFLVDGRVADVGSYADLLARNAAFRSMIQAPV